MRVKELENVAGYIEEFALTKRCDAHSVCKFTMSVRESDAEKIIGMVGLPISVFPDGTDMQPVFFGEVSKITFERTFSRTRIFFIAVSRTKLLDEKTYTRVFQNPEKKIGEVLSAVRLAISGCNLLIEDELKVLAYPHILLQSQETNFQFIKRLAGYAGRRLWIVDTRQGNPEIVIGTSIEETDTKILPTDILQCSAEYSAAGKRMRIVARTPFSFGRVVQIGNDLTKFLVAGWELRLVHGVDRFFYDLEEYKPKPIQWNTMPLEKSVKLRAHVKDVNDPKYMGRVMVEIVQEDAEDKDTKKAWIPYRSPYSGTDGGIVFLPDKGDTVEVIFLNGEIFVASTLREKSLNEECKNVTEKYIGNNFKQRILWKEKSLEICSDKNRIYLDKDMIELSVGESKIMIDKHGISLKTNGNEALLDEEGIRFQSGNGFLAHSKRDMKIESNSSLSLLASNKTQLQGSNVVVKASGGNVDISGSNVRIN